MSLCACMGPQQGQPYCPCQMQALGLSDGKEYVWSEEDKARLKKALETLRDREIQPTEDTGYLS